MKLLSVIVKPAVTEKSTSQNLQIKYVLKVHQKADKKAIKKAFEEIYKVKAVSVRTMVLPEKTRMMKRGKLLAKREVTKRAIITVEKGKTIDPNKIK